MIRSIGRFSIKAALPLIAAMALAVPGQAAFLSAFEGYSVFGNDDQGNVPPPGVTCPLCDSTVSFAVWQNTDGDWRDDLPTVTDLVGASSGQERYVYLYQVFNTNPLGGSNQNLENYNISFGPPGTLVPFQTGGFMDNTVFASASNAVFPLDTPNDGVPSSVSTVTPFAAEPDAVDPAALVFNLISHPGVAGGNAFEGAQFLWDSADLIGADETSSVLVLTSDIAPTYRWAESESPGGFGAPGDVPSIAAEPGTVALLALGLAGLGARRRGARP